MAPRQLTRRMAGFADRTQYFSVLIELHDAVVTAIDHPDVLVRGDEQSIRITDTGPFPEIVSIGIEDLNALVLPIADIDVAAAVYHDTVRQIELTGPGAELSPRFDEF